MWLVISIVVALGGWVPPGEHHTDHFTFYYSKGARQDALALAERAEAVRRRIVSDLGRAPPSPTRVVVVATRAEFVRAQPGRKLPDWVAGVAYARQNLILLGPAPPGGQPRAREVLLAHEYSHVALAHATGFRSLPKWFAEGFADLQAMAPYVGDWRSWGASGALPIGQLHRSLGDDRHRASSSYEQSYDLVRFLRGQGDAVQFRRLIRALAQGTAFDRALKEIYNITPGQLESRWRTQWNWQRVIVPMITSGLFLWVIAAVLLVIGYYRKRRERRAAIEAMEGSEDEEGETDEEVDEGSEDEGNEDDEDDEEEVGQMRGASARRPWGVLRAPGGAPGGGPGGAGAGGAGRDEKEEPVAGPVLFLSFGTLLVGTLTAVILTALLTLFWPYTRLWVLAGPAVVVTFLTLRWVTRK